MLYAFIDGDGEADVAERLEGLLATPCGEGEGIWFCFLHSGDPSPAMAEIVTFANSSVYYEVVWQKGAEAIPLYAGAEFSHEARDPWVRMIDLLHEGPVDGEPAALLVLLGPPAVV